jgi:hypothetical protein
MSRLPAGEKLYVRHFQREVVCGLYVGQVVRHDDDGLLMWTPQRSHHWFPFMPDGRPMRGTPLPEWHGAAWVWQPVVSRRSVLRWYPPTAPYSIEAWFDGDVLSNYYANLGGPAAVWCDADGHGADTEDWDLDVWIDPDLSWRLKDEQDIRERSGWPELYWVDDPAQVYEVGLEIVAQVEARAFPFDGSWRDFASGHTAEPLIDPALPPGWDRPRHRAVDGYSTGASSSATGSISPSS